MQDPVAVQHADPETNTIIVAFRDAGKRLLFADFSVDSLLQNPVVPINLDRHASYESWISKIASADSIEKSDPLIISQKSIENELFPQGNLIQLQTLPVPVYHSKEGAGLFLISLWTEAMQRQILFVNSYLLFNDWQASYLSLLHYLKVVNLDMTSLYYHGPGILTRINGTFTQLVHDYAEFSLAGIAYIDGNSYLPYSFKGAYKVDIFKEDGGPADYSYHGPSVTATLGYELPSSYHNIFPKRALKGSITYFKSLHSDWDFSTIDLSVLAATNLYSEKIGLTTRAHYVSSSGDVSPSAVTGIDQDYSYAFPRDYRNTKTIRGIRKNIFGDKLIWNSTELTLLLAQQTPMKILFLPVNELALSGFLDLARIENSDANLTSDLYSYGAELSIGFGALRLGAGYAIGNIDGSERDGEYYGRLTVNITNVFSGLRIDN